MDLELAVESPMNLTDLAPGITMSYYNLPGGELGVMLARNGSVANSPELKYVMEELRRYLEGRELRENRVSEDLAIMEGKIVSEELKGFRFFWL